LKGELAAARAELIAENGLTEKAVSDNVRLAGQLAVARAPWWRRVVGG
jgi:hypothetical protein